jgi:hypothetical protein
MENLYYNVIELNISNGLKDEVVDIIGDGNYLILQYAPSDANVKVRLNNNFNPQILLKANSGIEAVNTKKIFISCNAIAGATITFIHSKSSAEFRYIPPIAGKLDIGTVDTIKLVEELNVVHTLKNIETEITASGASKRDRSYYDLLDDYSIVKSYMYFDSWEEYDNRILLNDRILQVEQEINPELEEIDWDMFDVVYYEVVIELQSNFPDEWNNNENYATLMIRPCQEDDRSYVHTTDYINNAYNSNTGQVLHKAFTSQELKKYTEIGMPIEILAFNPPSEAVGNLFASLTLLKKPMDIQKTVELYSHELQNQQTATILDIDTGIETSFVSYTAAKISFEISGIKYFSPLSIDVKNLSRGISYNIDKPYDSYHDTYLNYLIFNYDYEGQGAYFTAWVEGGDGKIQIDNIKIEILGYL